MSQYADIAARKHKMLDLLAKSQAGAQATQMAGYDATRRMASPQTYRPKPEDPAAKLTRWVQAALCALLGLKLPLTGVMDAATRAALLRFQREAGLAQTGAVDDATVRKLEAMVGVPAPQAQTPPPPWNAQQPRAAPTKPQPKQAKDDNATASSEPQPDDGRHAFEDHGGVHRYGEAEAHQLWRDGEIQSNGNALQAMSVERFMQREAVHGAMTLAFTRDWLKDELERTGRQGESALLAEVLAWWERAVSAEPDRQPKWLQEVTQLARPKQDEAVARLRHAWQKQGA